MKVIYISRRTDDDSKNGFLKLKIKVGQQCVNVRWRGRETRCSILTQLVYILCDSDFLCELSSLPDWISLPLSSHLQQDFLYFSTLLSVHLKLCFSTMSSHVSSPPFVAAAVLKQVLDAIWPAGKSVLLDGISTPVWEGKRERDKMLKRERDRLHYGQQRRVMSIGRFLLSWQESECVNCSCE